MSPTLEYDEQLMIFHAFENMPGMVHLRDLIEAREVIDVQKLFNFCN